MAKKNVKKFESIQGMVANMAARGWRNARMYTKIELASIMSQKILMERAAMRQIFSMGKHFERLCFPAYNLVIFVRV